MRTDTLERKGMVDIGSQRPDTTDMQVDRIGYGGEVRRG